MQTLGAPRLGGAPASFTRRSAQAKSGAGLRTARRGVVCAAENDMTALEVLKRENELLRQTIEDASFTVQMLESQVAGMTGTGAESYIAGTGDRMAEMAARGTPIVGEDLWAPLVRAPQDGALVDTKGDIFPMPSHDGTECLQWDQTLWSHANHFRYRWSVYKGVRQAIELNEGGFDKFTQAYKYFGINRGEHDGKKGVWYREWAPGCQAIALVGTFNNWEPQPSHWAIRNEFGVFQLFIPDNADGTPAIPHMSKVKARVQFHNGHWADRIPAYIRWATQEWNEVQFNGVNYMPPEMGKPGVLEANKTYVFKYPRPPRPRSLRVYECHIGMSSEEPKINTYVDFRDNVLPRIRRLGYNAIQIMAIQEHAYYGSFGYHVTNFFAPSSRFGTPDELKSLIDEAHRMGLHVLMDIVHSHASKNANDGIDGWDGTDHQYFHSGARGYHWVWDSRCFNYGNWETLRFLLSNTRYWMDEFKFDGFRFDGVTSMMYTHHGLGMAFTGNYDEYFGMATDVDAVVYLMLVNTLVKGFYPNSVVVGEDVSGMPTFCRPVQEGGVGFDYRLHMAIPDMWIETMKKGNDYAWGMGHMVFTLTNRRYAEDVIGYAESHDQALVGDKTIAFWLMDKHMYDGMAVAGYGPQEPAVDRGIALHKMIRTITMALGGQGYLNFMGNEFGHPEWIDFPRVDFVDPSTGRFIKGNGGSLHHCRRRWDLCDAEFLRYKHMNAWDRAMQHLDKAFGFITAPHQWVSKKDEGDKLVVVERGDLVFVFNFHPEKSFTDYRVGCYHKTEYKIVLTSDEEVFGGYKNLSKNNDATFVAEDQGINDRPHSFRVYAPSRTVAVYAPAQWVDASNETIPGLGVKGLGPYPEVTAGMIYN